MTLWTTTESKSIRTIKTIGIVNEHAKWSGMRKSLLKRMKITQLLSEIGHKLC